MLKILVLAAGAGQRFTDAGYEEPKPLIPMYGRPMIEHVVNSTGFNQIAQTLNVRLDWVYVIQEGHYAQYIEAGMFKKPNEHVVKINGVTSGAAISALAADGIINDSDQLVIINSDQLLEWDPAAFLGIIKDPNVHGLIALFKDTDPKWSFAKIDNGLITQVAEKDPISDNATVGIYYWSSWADFKRYVNDAIADADTVNGEYYVAPIYNRAIADGKQIYPIFVDQMWGLGTPEDLQAFINSN